MKNEAAGAIRQPFFNVFGIIFHFHFSFSIKFCIFAAKLKYKFKSATMNPDKLINRTIASAITSAMRYLPVVTLIGPRQSGKTTLCRRLFDTLPYVNFEDVATLTEVKTDPKSDYDTYFHLQNEIVAAYRQLREQRAVKVYHKAYSRCSESQREALQQYYPQRVAEEYDDNVNHNVNPNDNDN